MNDIYKIFTDRRIDKQTKLFYLGINYKGIVQDYYLLGEQQGFGNVPNHLLYNGEKFKTTISDITLEGLIK